MLEFIPDFFTPMQLVINGFLVVKMPYPTTKLQFINAFCKILSSCFPVFFFLSAYQFCLVAFAELLDNALDEVSRYIFLGNIFFSFSAA